MLYVFFSDWSTSMLMWILSQVLVCFLSLCDVLRCSFYTTFTRLFVQCCTYEQHSLLLIINLTQSQHVATLDSAMFYDLQKYHKLSAVHEEILQSSRLNYCNFLWMIKVWHFLLSKVNCGIFTSTTTSCVETAMQDIVKISLWTRPDLQTCVHNLRYPPRYWNAQEPPPTRNWDAPKLTVFHRFSTIYGFNHEYLGNKTRWRQSENVTRNRQWCTALLENFMNFGSEMFKNTTSIVSHCL